MESDCPPRCGEAFGVGLGLVLGDLTDSFVLRMSTINIELVEQQNTTGIARAKAMVVVTIKHNGNLHERKRWLSTKKFPKVANNITFNTLCESLSNTDTKWTWTAGLPNSLIVCYYAIDAKNLSRLSWNVIDAHASVEMIPRLAFV